MKYKLLILIFLLNFFQSCDNKEKKQAIELEEKKIKATKDSLELVKKNRLDSITKIEEKIALGNINFGINKEEYLIKQKEFKKITDGRLGEFEFLMSESYDENGGLRKIKLYDYLGVHYDYYERNMLKKILSLKEILFEKYGEPTSQKEFPEWTDFERDEKKNIFYWEIGNKSIWVDIENTHITNYELSITISYISPEDLDKFIKESEQNEKQLKEKALKNL